MKLLYFWEFDVVGEHRSRLRKRLQNWAKWNSKMPKGVQLLGIYETFVGEGVGSSFQVVMETADLVKLQEAEGSDGLRELHQAIGEGIVPGSIRNRLLRAIE